MRIDRRNEIPDYPYYVMCNDTFLGDTLILPCKNWDMAKHVRDHADMRKDQERVRIVTNKPRVSPYRLYTLHDWNDYPTWYGLRDDFKPFYFDD